MISRFEQFVSSVSCIYRYIQKIERVEMAKYGLKGPHAQCLLAMSRYPGGITASELCSVCDKDKAAISRTVAELEREGLISRTAKNGSMYRAVLKLTPQGEEIAHRMLKRHRTIATFLEKLGVDGTTALEDACKIEHDISEASFQAICRFLEQE